MLNNPWLMSWLVAATCWIGAFVILQRSGFGAVDAMIFATPFFTAPIAVAIGGSNSFLYAFDLLPPIIFIRVIPQWRRIPVPAKRIGGWFLLGMGIIPLVLTAVFVPARMELLFVLINAYRLFAAVGLFWLAAIAPVRPDKVQQFHDGNWLGAFTCAALVLAVALVLQYSGRIDANVFYNWSAYSAVSEDRTMGLGVAGLFRGSLGIIGTMGIAAFAATGGRRSLMELRGVAGAVAGLAAIVVVGSKTSLIVGGLILCLVFIRSLTTNAGKFITTIVLAAATVLILGRYIVPMLPEKYVDRVFGALVGKENSINTLTGRMDRWQDGLQLIDTHPLTLFAMEIPQNPSGEGSGITYWHNEYLGLLINGGLFSFGAYVGGLILLGRLIWKNFNKNRPVLVFAALIYVNGLLQAFTVGHLVPGIYFSSTVGLSFLAYGMALNEHAFEILEPATEDLPMMEPIGAF